MRRACSTGSDVAAVTTTRPASTSKHSLSTSAARKSATCWIGTGMSHWRSSRLLSSRPIPSCAAVCETLQVNATMCNRATVASFLIGLGTFCAASLASGHHLGAVRVLVATVAAATITVVLAQAHRHWRLVRALQAVSRPGELAGMHVRTGELGDAVFVAGLSRPTIYCDHRLPEQLT